MPMISTKLNKLLYRRNFQTLKSFYDFINQQEGIKFKIADRTKDRTLINRYNYPLMLKQGYGKDRTLINHHNYPLKQGYEKDY